MGRSCFPTERLRSACLSEAPTMRSGRRASHLRSRSPSPSVWLRQTPPHKWGGVAFLRNDCDQPVRARLRQCALTDERPTYVVVRPAPPSGFARPLPINGEELLSYGTTAVSLFERGSDSALWQTRVTPS